MTAPFTIHSRPGELDRLSEAVIQSFNRPVSKPLYRNGIWTLGFTLLTVGLWPLWKSNRWLRDFAAVREQRCWHLAEWLRLNSDDDVARLQQLADRIRPNPLLGLTMRLVLIAALVVLVSHRQPYASIWRNAFTLPTTHGQQYFTALLCAAALILLAQLVIHQGQFKQYLSALNPLLTRHGFSAVVPPAMFRFVFLDWLCGLALSAQGSAWPLVTLVSIGLYRSYARRSLLTHAALGERVRALLSRATPPLRLPLRSDFLPRCGRAECGAILASDAKFCGRCGMEVQ